MIGTVFSSRYQVLSKLGEGGHSTVYRARDEVLEREVAIKVMHVDLSSDEAARERFRREARSVARLSHPNVVNVIDAGRDDDGFPFIVFEYVTGQTLKHRVRQRERLPIAEAVAYAIEIALGLAAAHDHGLVHRDVKPQNVLIDDEGRGKITDFGIAVSGDTESITDPGRVLGTTDYVSPEQAMGRPVDGRSDLYSLGIVLYEMLVGEVPFHADNPVGVAMKHVREAVPDVQRKRPEVSAALASVVERATAKHPANRYPDARSMLGELEQALEVEAARAGTTAGEATVVLDAVKAQRPIGSRRSWGLAGLAGLAGTVGAALAIVLASGDDTEREPLSARTAADEKARIALSAGDASDFDPECDEREHSELVGLAVDGDPRRTLWTTETYKVRDLGKPGVGLAIDLGSRMQVSELRMRSARAGWDFEVRASAEDSAPDSIEDWRLLKTVANASTDEEVTVPATASGDRHYLVWITRLAPTDTEDRYAVEISDVGLFR
ncbi:MAG: protein kinase domain-containing protein [Solirubrobacterales bacterium]